MSLINELINSIETSRGENIVDLFKEYLEKQNSNILNPNYDLIETNTHLIILLEIPGVLNKSINIFFNGCILNVSGSKNPINDLSGFNIEKEEIIKKSIIDGDFNKEIKLPIYVTDKENVKLVNELGILKIIIKKNNDSSFNMIIN